MKIIPHKKTGENKSPSQIKESVRELFPEPFWTPFDLIDRMPPFPRFPLFNTPPELNLPAVDISETDKEFLIEADLPGFKPEEVTVELDGNILILKGKKEEQTEEKNKTYHLRERSEAEWERHFTMPENSDLEKINCETKDGKLTIIVPKTTNNNIRKLKITHK